MMKKCCKLFFLKSFNLELRREDFSWVVKELRKREAEEDGNHDADPTVVDFCDNFSTFDSITKENEGSTINKLWSASLHKNPELLIVQNVFHFAHFVYIACTLSSASGWQQYQELFARWLNSGSGMNAVVNFYFSDFSYSPKALVILQERYRPSVDQKEDQNCLRFFFLGLFGSPCMP